MNIIGHYGDLSLKGYFMKGRIYFSNDKNIQEETDIAIKDMENDIMFMRMRWDIIMRIFPYV